jgi:DNA polymerase-3 subunit beta
LHITCQKNDIAAAVNTVRRSIATNSPIPALKGILLTAEEKMLTLESTDTELRISCTIPAEVLEEGSVLIPASYFGDLIRLLSDEEVEIKTIENGQSVQVNYTNSTVKFNCFDLEDYPVLKESGDSPLFGIHPYVLSESIKQVSFAASKDFSRPVLTGTLFDIKTPELMTLVATDSHRLTRKDVQINPLKEDIQPISAIIPSRALNELNRVITGNTSDDEEAQVLVGISESSVFFKYGSTLIFSQLIDGQYPHYDEVIPSSITTTVNCETADLTNSLNRASLIAHADMKGRIGGVVKKTVEDNQMKIYAQSQDVGEVKEIIPIEKNGEDIEIAFNSRYLLDVLKAVGSQRIKIEYSGSLSPALFKFEEEDNYLYLVLPIRIS